MPPAELCSDRWNANGTLGDAMFDLDPVGRYRLERPPLVQALGEIRYPLRARLQTLDGVADLQDRLAAVFPYMEQDQIQQVSLLMGPGVPPRSDTQTTRAWRFTDDAGWTLVINAQAATLSVGPDYGDFDEFRTRFAEAISALHETNHLPRCDRLGLRSGDIAETPPGEEGAWREWFRPEMTGWPGSPVVGPNASIATTITQTQLAATPTGEFAGIPHPVQGIVRHGYIPANTMVPGLVRPTPIETPAFLQDIDLFIEGHQPFDSDELARQVTLLHDQVDRFFRWSLTDTGAEYFGLEEIR
jgi:uncharacterized protein (TIGR04255 family)